MITIRYFSIAFLECDGKQLMMKRNGKSEIATNMWAPVGGHIEDGEHRDPYRSCLREILEETGIEETEISGLELKYIVMRKKKNEIRIQYVYFGSTMQLELASCDEGTLHWINEDELSGLNTTFTTKEIIKKQCNSLNSIEKIQVGIVDEDGDIPYMNWSNIEDWENEKNKGAL